MRKHLAKVCQSGYSYPFACAGVAQLVEQLICNQPVAGSSPIASSKNLVGFPSGQREQTVNLSAYAFGGSNPPPTTILITGDLFRNIPALGGGAGSRRRTAGIAQLARASAFQAEGCGFESRFPLHTLPSSLPVHCFFLECFGISPASSEFAHVAQEVEHFLGKEEVTGSNPVMGSIFRQPATAYQSDAEYSEGRPTWVRPNSSARSRT